MPPDEGQGAQRPQKQHRHFTNTLEHNGSGTQLPATGRGAGETKGTKNTRQRVLVAFF